MVRYGERSRKDRSSLAILEVAVGKHQRVNRRKAIADNAIFAHEATLDTRSTIHVSIVINYKVACAYIYTDIRSCTYGSIFKM